MTSPCECGIENSGFITIEGFLDHLSDYKIVKKAHHCILVGREVLSQDSI
jgi:hypothetical protein